MCCDLSVQRMLLRARRLMCRLAAAAPAVATRCTGRKTLPRENLCFCEDRDKGASKARATPQHCMARVPPYHSALQADSLQCWFKVWCESIEPLRSCAIPGRTFACHLMDAAAGAMGIARGDALFALAALLWHRHQLSWPLAMHLSMLS